MTKQQFLLPALALLFAGLGSVAQSTNESTGTPASQPPASIIPEPVSTQWHNGHFLIDKSTVLVAEETDKPSV
ncbi:MAG TPA: hypothetical protein VGR89_13820, partial [Puia sp.]|nr:hypothetical protein [Puia sp.]